MASLNKTPLFDYHYEVGAKTVPVGNWTMPFQFGDGFREEYLHALEGTCIADFCCSFILRLTGENFAAMRDIAPDLEVGEGKFAVWEKDGRIIDTPLAVRMGEDDFLCSFAPSAKMHCTKFFSETGRDDLSEIFGSIALFGETVFETLTKLNVCIDDWQPGKSYRIEIDSVRCIAVYVLLYDELPCIMLFCDREKAEDVWIALFNTEDVWAAGTGVWNLLLAQQQLPPYNAVNVPLPLLSCKWNGRSNPQIGEVVEWSAENELQESQVIYASQLPHADGAILLFTGKFEANACVKTKKNKDENGILLAERAENR